MDQGGATSYAFYDFERTWALIGLAAAFAVMIVAVARWRGLRALLGIVAAFVVLVVFLLPALRDGAPAIPVALIASAAILYAVIYLAHGVSLQTSAALLGTLTSLLLAAVFSSGAIQLAHLTGLSEDQNAEVSAYLGHVSITGLLLAGFIIGSLGVLNDVTVTQASTVFELAKLSDGASRRVIFGAAMRVGRDHIASTVYTLVLAYAGSALPLLLLFSVANRSLSDVLTSESVAIEIARSAVGGIALALSVPLTTAIAAIWLPLRPGRRCPLRATGHSFAEEVVRFRHARRPDRRRLRVAPQVPGTIGILGPPPNSSSASVANPAAAHCPSTPSRRTQRPRTAIRGDRRRDRLSPAARPNPDRRRHSYP